MFRCIFAKAAWCLGLTLACFANVATASSSYYDNDCADCHGAAPANPRTCTGCHYHATHPASGTGVVDVTQFNLVATTDKTSYTTGDTITVTLSGGNKTEESWTRLRLYNVNGTPLNTTCTRCSFTSTLTARAVAGTTRLRVGWYGNKSREHMNAAYARDSGGATTDSTTQANHTEEVVLTNSFTVTDAMPAGNTGAASEGGGGGSFDVFVLLAALFGAGRARRR